MTGVSTTIDGLLRSSPVLHQLKKFQDMAETNLTLFDHIAGFGTAALEKTKEERDAYFGEPYARIEFYRMRYLAIIVWLKAFGQLQSHAKVDDVFKPERYKGIFEPDGRPAEER